MLDTGRGMRLSDFSDFSLSSWDLGTVVCSVEGDTDRSIGRWTTRSCIDSKVDRNVVRKIDGSINRLEGKLIADR